MMLMNSEGHPSKSKIEAYLADFSRSIIMTKKDKDYILAVEEELRNKREEEEKMLYKKYQLAEHKRVQQMLDKGQAKYTELMPQEVKQFKLLHGEESEELEKLTRCPSPSPVKNTEAFNQLSSVFLSRQFLERALRGSFVKTTSQSEEEDDQFTATMYDEPAFDQMSKATRVDDLYTLAHDLIGTTKEGCKDLINIK